MATEANSKSTPKKAAANKSAESTQSSVKSSSVKGETVSKYRLHDKDCGSPEVQVALLTSRLERLSQHFAKNPKDAHSQYGMLKIVSKRKYMLQYLKDADANRYKNLISSLGLRK